MSLSEAIVEGTLKPDGTLELDDQLGLPAGRVRVTVQALSQSDAPNAARFWAMLEKIWADQKARGHVPRTKEEIDADLQSMRQGWEQHQLGIERLQEECQRAREQSQDKEPRG